jgi:hypothetical protein
MRMVTCWAEPLGGCGSVQSREHYLSRAIIGSGEVAVSGFPFLQGKARTIPGERLVAKMLCKIHNERLSPLDSSAGHFFQVLSAFKQRGIMRARGAKKPGGIDMYEVDGALVERWMLKTLINVMFDRELTSDRKWRPPELWVRCVYGLAVFPDWCGLYLLPGQAKVTLGNSGVGIRLLTADDDDDTVTAAQFRMADVQFALSMEPLATRHQHLYRLRAMKDKPSLDVLQIVHFRWTSLSSA